jgi:hypothetical protein
MTRCWGRIRPTRGFETQSLRRRKIERRIISLLLENKLHAELMGLTMTPDIDCGVLNVTIAGPGAQGNGAVEVAVKVIVR